MKRSLITAFLDASDIRREFQKAAATAFENDKAKP